MRNKTLVLMTLAAVGCCICLFSAGFVCGTIQANRRTLSRAMEVIDTIKTPVDKLNAQDAAAIVAASATPRWRRADELGEQYKPHCWVNTAPLWEKR